MLICQALKIKSDNPPIVAKLTRQRPEKAGGFLLHNWRQIIPIAAFVVGLKVLLPIGNVDPSGKIHEMPGDCCS